MPLVARVEWRSEHRKLQQPAALVCGGERSDLEVERSWVEGPAVAGGPLVRVFIASDAAGRRVRIRAATGGRTTVEVASR
jgi:hypothetical protein